MPQKTEKLAILFADISGSTELYDKHGDGLARQMVARCINTMSGAVHSHQGTLIKTIGDEIMCRFPSAEAALRAACAMQTAVENYQPSNTLPLSVPMHIRVGFNYGDVIIEQDDVYGDTVNVAARITAITRSRQISATQAVMDALPPALRQQAHKIRRTEIKGKQEQFDIFQIEWDAGDMSRTRIGEATLRIPIKTSEELTLNYLDQTLKINKHHKNAVLGREQSCEIISQNSFASRQHARIEFRFGKFILTDQSMNGTYIKFNDKRVLSVVREAVVLLGSGVISLGQNFSENPTDLVKFSVTPGDA